MDAAVEPDALVILEAGTGDSGQEPAVDFAVQDCPKWEETDGGLQCVSIAPLTLGFVPLSAGTIETYQWDFGDGSGRATDPYVHHEYDEVGTYSVSLLVGGSFGILDATKAALVRIRMSKLSEYCLRNDTCFDGLCLCRESGSDDPDCPVDLIGTCTEPCAAQPCSEGAVCVDLRAGLSGDVPMDGWRRPVCFPFCLTDRDCSRPGSSCRFVPQYESDQGVTPLLVRACVPDVLGAVGVSCLDGASAPDDTTCLYGLCRDVGTSGMCSMQCQADTCPPESACLLVTGTQQAVCVPRCGSGTNCENDPLLSCESPDASGFYGFSVLDVSADQNATYCMPKRCNADSDCGQAGHCDDTIGQFCVRGK
ncbi:MAG: PKD domain-containing protein [Deltaproteobacteria bacterium]|nr:PKD domain-containing protein [Deltaproteobacteria bacterium]